MIMFSFQGSTSKSNMRENPIKSCEPIFLNIQIKIACAVKEQSTDFNQDFDRKPLGLQFWEIIATLDSTQTHRPTLILRLQ